MYEFHILFTFLNPRVNSSSLPLDTLCVKKRQSLVAATFTSGLVRQLVAHEADKNQDSPALPSIRVVELLGSHFSHVIGREGFRTLVARAVNLTARTFPAMVGAKLGSDGKLVGVSEANVMDPDAAPALLVNIFELVITLIGEDITLRMVCTIWPDFKLEATNGKETELA